MAKPTSIDHRSKDILRALMDPAEPELITWSSSDLRAILEHQLATPLASELDAFAEAGRMSTEQVLRILDDCGRETVLDVIREASECAGAIQLIKDLAKASLAHGRDLPRDVARVLYVLTIVRGQQAGVSGLTSLDNASLERETRRCLTFGWLPDEIRCLLRVERGSQSKEKGP